MLSLLLRREHDREVAGALADPRRAAHRARAEALERRALVGVGRLRRPRSSPTSSWLCSALAIADSSSLLQSRATARGVNARIARASGTDLPRMWSQTRRALRADERTYLAWARTTTRRRRLGRAALARRPASPRPWLPSEQAHRSARPRPWRPSTPRRPSLAELWLSLSWRAWAWPRRPRHPRRPSSPPSSASRQPSASRPPSASRRPWVWRRRAWASPRPRPSR